MRTADSLDSLDITDYLMVLPVLRNYGSMDSVPLADIQWMTRQAGKSLFLHGEWSYKIRIICTVVSTLTTASEVFATEPRTHFAYVGSCFDPPARRLHAFGRRIKAVQTP